MFLSFQELCFGLCIGTSLTDYCATLDFVAGSVTTRSIQVFFYASERLSLLSNIGTAQSVVALERNHVHLLPCSEWLP